jgi:hypothetical protein
MLVAAFSISCSLFRWMAGTAFYGCNHNHNQLLGAAVKKKVQPQAQLFGAAADQLFGAAV